jgi:hypothetical protein
MAERNANGAVDIPLAEQLEDEALDIVGRTGEEMPLAMHDQGHKTFQATTPQHAFDPRLPDREP